MANEIFRFHRNIFAFEFKQPDSGKNASKFSLLLCSPFALLQKDKLVMSVALKFRFHCIIPEPAHTNL